MSKKKAKLVIAESHLVALFHMIHGYMNNCLFDVIQGNKSARSASSDFWRSLHGLLRYELSKKQVKYWNDNEKKDKK